ncbi:MAG: hypothetical protein H0Z34_11180 [Brevibacillus sp.]|nr:hypothetical protein [Brevibacillus sp.]
MTRRIWLGLWAGMIWSCTTLLAGCVLQQDGLAEDVPLSTLPVTAGNVSPSASPTEEPRTETRPKQQPLPPESEKTVQTTTYRVQIPAGLQVQHAPGDVVYLQRDGKTIGGINVYSFYKEHQDITVLMPKYSRTVKSEALEGLSTEAIRFLLERTPTDETSLSTVREVHTYFLQSPLAYDVWVKDGVLSQEEYRAMLNSFHLFHAGGNEREGG